MHPWDPPHREGAASYSWSLCHPSCCPAVTQGLHRAEQSLVPRGVMNWPQLSNFLSPACPSCLAWPQCWVLGDRAALHGTSLLHRAGAHYPSPCACPLLSLLCSHRCQLHSRTLSQGWQRGCLVGASTDPSEREQSAGSSMEAASLELLLPALTNTFIRINEACNKRIGEAKKAAETKAAAGSRQEGDEGVCGQMKLARAAEEQHTSLGPFSQIPTWTCRNAHVSSSSCTQP